MTVEISVLPQGVLCARVSGASDDEDTSLIIQSVIDLAASGSVDRLLLDLSDQTSSTLDAIKARSTLSSVNRGLARIWQDEEATMALAIAAPVSSFGYGIGRMISGHAYDLARLRVEQFDSRENGLTWLAAPDRPN